MAKEFIDKLNINGASKYLDATAILGQEVVTNSSSYTITCEKYNVTNGDSVACTVTLSDITIIGKMVIANCVIDEVYSNINNSTSGTFTNNKTGLFNIGGHVITTQIDVSFKVAAESQSVYVMQDAYIKFTMIAGTNQYVYQSPNRKINSSSSIHDKQMGACFIIVP